MPRIDNDLVSLVMTSQMKSGNNYGTGMLIVDASTNKLLLARRVDTKELASPGGKVELQETPLQGALRETLEESNVIVHKCMIYDYEMHTSPNGKNWVSFMFITRDFDASNIVNQESEMEPFSWYTVEEALNSQLFPPTRKSIERAIECGVLDFKDKNTENYIPFVNMPNLLTYVQDSECCSYSIV